MIKSMITMAMVAVIIGLVSLLVVSCRSLFASPKNNPKMTVLWELWQSGTWEALENEARKYTQSRETRDEGHFMLCLLSHVRGNYSDSIDHFEKITQNYPYRTYLMEPVLWSYYFTGAYKDALHLIQEGPPHKVTEYRLKQAMKYPVKVSIQERVILPFTDDELTPMMPGAEMVLNGKTVTARLDTGGSFLHVSPSFAEQLGLEHPGISEKTFGALGFNETYYTIGNLEIGSITIGNVPIAVHDLGPAVTAFEQMYGIRVDVIFGTNILQQFLTTIDPVHNRFIFSPQAGMENKESHLGLLDMETAERTPFYMLYDHFMHAPGIVDQKQSMFFVDSGLVVFTDTQGMASYLVPEGTLSGWETQSADNAAFPVLLNPSGFENLLREDAKVFMIPDKTWRNMGDWSGITVDAMISWGYLRQYIWTIDFMNREYILSM